MIISSITLLICNVGVVSHQTILALKTKILEIFFWLHIANLWINCGIWTIFCMTWWNGNSVISWTWALLITFFWNVQHLSLWTFYIAIIILLACCNTTTVIIAKSITFKGIFATFTGFKTINTLITTDKICTDWVIAIYCMIYVGEYAEYFLL